MKINNKDYLASIYIDAKSVQLKIVGEQVKTFDFDSEECSGKFVQGIISAPQFLNFDELSNHIKSNFKAIIRYSSYI